MSGFRSESAVARSGAASRMFGVVAVVGVLCAMTLYAYESGQWKSLPAQLQTNSSTTALVGEPPQ